MLCVNTDVYLLILRMKITICADGWRNLRMLRRKCSMPIMTRSRMTIPSMENSARGRVTESRLHPMPTTTIVASAAGMTGDQTTSSRKMQLLPATRGYHCTAGTVQLLHRRTTTERHCSAGMAVGGVEEVIKRLDSKLITLFEKGSTGDQVQGNVPSTQDEEHRHRGHPSGLGADLGGPRLS